MASVRKLLLAPLFILPILALGVPVALAAGQINALTAAPNPTFARKPVTFSIQGTGNCRLSLNFGDGAPPLAATVPLPYQPPAHSYARAGTYTAIAKPAAGAPCAGKASINVTIQFSTASSGGQAPNPGVLGQGRTSEVAPDATKDLQCMLNGCQPQIDPQGPLMLFSNITPGGGAIVLGSGFGGAVGPQNALILTLTTYFNVPLTVELQNLTWVDNAVGGTIPADIRGVPDGPATLQVVTAAGARSDLINVNFVATRDVLSLDSAEVNGYCSENGTDNYCQRSGTGTTITDLRNTCTQWNRSGWVPPTGAVAGGHNAGLSLIEGTNGDDTYRATLKNGWVFDSYNCCASTDNPGDSHDSAVIADGVFPYGRSQGEIDVSWSVDHCDEIEYDCDISIKGPLGVPAY